MNKDKFSKVVFVKIHQKAFYIDKLQVAINAEFKKAMTTIIGNKQLGTSGMGVDKTNIENKPLSILMLLSKKLITFDIPKKTTLVVGEYRNGYRHTGFMHNSQKRLVGWGLKVYVNGETEEGVWQIKGKDLVYGIKGLLRSVHSTSKSVT